MESTNSEEGSKEEVGRCLLRLEMIGLQMASGEDEQTPNIWLKVLFGEKAGKQLDASPPSQRDRLIRGFLVRFPDVPGPAIVCSLFVCRLGMQGRRYGG